MKEDNKTIIVSKFIQFLITLPLLFAFIIAVTFPSFDYNGITNGLIGLPFGIMFVFVNIYNLTMR
jgi:hypothetical protein